MRNRVPRSAALGVVLALLVAACGGAAADGEADLGSDDDVGAAGSAVLGVLDPGVGVADVPEDLTQATYRDGEDGESLVVGDVVRTDPTGFAQVAWFDGALARVDADTTYALVALDATPGAASVATQLDVGRIWNRLDVGATEGYEVRTDVGTAAVRGTAFWVSCRDELGCTFAVLEGEVVVTTADGTEVVLGPGDEVSVDDGGVPGPVAPTDADEAWVRRNLELDGDAGFAAIASPTDDDGAVAADCPFVEIPAGWTRVSAPGQPCELAAPADEPSDFLRLVVSPGTGELAQVVDSLRRSHPMAVEQVTTSQCGEGSVERMLVREEPLGSGELTLAVSRIRRGPFPSGVQSCPVGGDSHLFGVVIGGQGFILELDPQSSVTRCPKVPGARDVAAEDWLAFTQCWVVDMIEEHERQYLELATTLLGG